MPVIVHVQGEKISTWRNVSGQKRAKICPRSTVVDRVMKFKISKF